MKDSRLDELKLVGAQATLTSTYTLKNFRVP